MQFDIYFSLLSRNNLFKLDYAPNLGRFFMFDLILQHFQLKAHAAFNGIEVMDNMIVFQ